MARIDPAFIPTLTDLTRGLRELDVPFCIIGALVPELLLDSGSARMTNDADVTVVDDGERYGLDYAGEGVPFEYTCAYLLGQDCRRFLDPAVTAAARCARPIRERRLLGGQNDPARERASSTRT